MTQSRSAADTSALLVQAMPAVFVVLWSTGFIGAKYGLPYAPPLKFLLWRFVFVIALMTAVALATRAPWPRGFKIAHVAVAGILLQAGYLGGVFLSMSHGMTAGLVALIVGIQPILTAASGPLIGERVTARQWLGLLFGFGGVALVVWDKVGVVGVGWGAVAFAIVALLSITGGTIYQKRYCGAQDLRTQSVLQFIAAGLVLLPFSLAFETRPVVWAAPLVFAILWLSFGLSLGAITLLLILIRRGAATTVTSLMYLVPPMTALMAWWLFGEKLAAPGLAGMAVAVLGVWMVVRK